MDTRESKRMYITVATRVSGAHLTTGVCSAKKHITGDVKHSTIRSVTARHRNASSNPLNHQTGLLVSECMYILKLRYTASSKRIQMTTWIPPATHACRSPGRQTTDAESVGMKAPAGARLVLSSSMGIISERVMCARCRSDLVINQLVIASIVDYQLRSELLGACVSRILPQK